MTIRFATLTDVPALIEGGKRMHALTRFRTQKFNEEMVENAFRTIIVKGQGKYAFLVAESSLQGVVGALIGVLEQQIFSDENVSSIMHFDVLPEARMGGYAVRLMKAFENWSRNRKAIEINFGVNSGIELQRTGSFAQRMGYSKVGVIFNKNLLAEV